MAPRLAGYIRLGQSPKIFNTLHNEYGFGDKLKTFIKSLNDRIVDIVKVSAFSYSLIRSINFAV
jgi:hypothetical protein